MNEISNDSNENGAELHTQESNDNKRKKPISLKNLAKKTYLTGKAAFWLLPLPHNAIPLPVTIRNRNEKLPDNGVVSKSYPDRRTAQEVLASYQENNLPKGMKVVFPADLSMTYLERLDREKESPTPALSR